MSSGTPTPTGAINRRGPFRPGERVQITDERGRITTITLAEGGEYHSHKGFLKHDDLIGAPEGTVIANTHGILYQARRSGTLRGAGAWRLMRAAFRSWAPQP